MVNQNFAIFQDTRSLKIFIGQLSSQVFEKIYTLGILWVFTQQGRSDLLPWFIVLGSLPHLFFLRLAPQWVHRFGALKMVYVTDFIRSALFVLTCLLIDHLNGQELIITLFALNFLTNAVGCFFTSSILTLPIQLYKGPLVQKLTALISSCFALSNVLGPLLALFLYEKFGLKTLLLVNGLSFFMAGLLGLMVKANKPEATEAKGMENQELAPSQTPQSPLSILKGDTLITKMLINFLGCNMVLGPLLILLPIFSKQVLSGSINAYATLELFMGLGMITGTILLSVWTIPGRIWHKIFFGLLMIGVSYFIFILSKTLFWASFGLFILGLSLEMVNIVVLNLFQTRPAESDVPGVMSMANFIGVSALPVAMCLVGITLGPLGIKGLGLLCAMTMILLSLRTPFIPQIREV